MTPKSGICLLLSLNLWASDESIGNYLSENITLKSPLNSHLLGMSLGQYTKPILLLVLIIVLVCLSLIFYESFSWSQLQSDASSLLAYVDQRPVVGLVLFAVFYGCICALPMPLVSVFTLLAGYLFGNVVGFLIVSSMSALGGSLMFLVVRYLLREWVEGILSTRFMYLQKAAQANNFMAALSVRLIPGMPFPIPAIVFGLSQLSLWKFYLSTQLGLLPTLFVYVNAGRSLAQIDSVDDILSPSLIGSLLLLAIMPLLLSFIVNRRKIAI